jgi:serine/threonine protein kinase
VYLAENKALERQQALKLVVLHNPSDRAQEEARVLERFRDLPNVVAVENASVELISILGGELNMLSIAMEYLPLGSLGKLASDGKRFGVRQVREILLDVLRGLDVLHNKNYLHRDVKPSNVLMATPHTVKLSDFGLTTVVGSSGGASPFGYRAHLPPEVVNNEPYTRLGDIYSVGVTGFRLLAWDEFVDALSRLDAGSLADSIRRGRFPPRDAYPLNVPPNMKTVINKAMRPDPGERYQSASAMKEALYGLTLECEWVREDIPDGPSWSAIYDQREYRITVVEGPRCFTVTQRRVPGGDLRRVSSLCSGALSHREALEYAHRLMVEFTMGRP